MIYELPGRQIEFLGGGHFIAESAQLIGSVRLHSDASVWFGAVIRADNDTITLGEGSNVQDGAILHTDAGIPLSIANNVTIGHQAMLHGCQVGSYSLIGIQAVLLNRSKIGNYCLIGAQTLVPEGMDIPDGVLVVGSPARIKRELTAAEREALERSALHYREKAHLYSGYLRRVHESRE